VSLEIAKKEKVEGKKKKQLIVNQHQIPMDEVKETKVVISFK